MHKAVVTLLLGSLAVPLGPSAAAATNICDLPPEERSENLVEPVELCGVTRISGSEAGVIRVHLSKQTTIQALIGTGKTVEIEGDGAFSGLALTEDRPDRQGRTIVATYSPIHRFGSMFDWWAFGPGKCGCVLTPGDYRLYLLATGARVTATLRLPGLSGYVDVAPAQAVGFQGKELTIRQALGTAVVSAADSFDFTSPGYAVWGMHLLNAGPGEHGMCEFEGDVPTPYPPGCPHPGAGSYGGNMIVGPSDGQYDSASRYYQPGRVGLGAFYTSAVPAPDVRMYGMWLSFD